MQEIRRPPVISLVNAMDSKARSLALLGPESAMLELARPYPSIRTK
jgi:hypothetical protein